MNILVVPAGSRFLVIAQPQENQDGELLANFEDRAKAEKYADAQRLIAAEHDNKRALQRRAQWIDNLTLPLQRQFGISAHDFVPSNDADKRPDQIVRAIAEQGRVRFSLSDVAKATSLPPRVVAGILTLLHMRGVLHLNRVVNSEIFECRQLSSRQQKAAG